jgi:hypothetical protein
MKRVLSLAVISCSLLLAVLSIGCGSRARPAAPGEKNIRALAVFYGRYIGSHRGQPPANEAAFKAFVKSLKPEDIAGMVDGATDAETLFISPRDKEPFVIRYGLRPGPGAPEVLIHEKNGLNGRRLVALGLGAVEEVDATRFAQLLPGS